MVYAAFRRTWEEDRGGGPPDQRVVYVTEVSQCLRRAWFQRVMGGAPSDESVVLMIMGDDVHYLMREMVAVGEGEVRCEKTLENGVIIRGRVDRIIGDAVVEFKTCAAIPKQPYDHHVDQVQLYMWLLGKKKAYVVCVSKINGKVKAFKVEPDLKRVEELLERSRLLSKHLREGTIPEKEEGKLCNYCEYKGTYCL